MHGVRHNKGKRRGQDGGVRRCMKKAVKKKKKVTYPDVVAMKDATEAKDEYHKAKKEAKSSKKSTE